MNNQDLNEGYNPLAGLRFDQTTSVVCEKCGGSIFNEGLLLRKVSKFIVANVGNKDSIIPVPLMYCIECKHVNEEFLPEPLKTGTAETEEENG